MPSRLLRATRFARLPVVLLVVSGGVVGLERLGVIDVGDWVLVLARMVLAVSVAALVIAGFMAFVVWWFWERHPR